MRRALRIAASPLAVTVLLIALQRPCTAADTPDQTQLPVKGLEGAASFFRDIARAAAIVDKCSKDKSDSVEFLVALLGGTVGVLSGDIEKDKPALLERLKLEAEVAELDVQKNFSCKSSWRAEVEQARRRLHEITGQDKDPEVLKLRKRKEELQAK